ncbi:cellulose-binding protein [Actinoplanes sp. ATCC 53533]|uniref:lytic polysaccharide monooxygenase auxiliary activity family 9 protein n=1 Tax=Actinoplanes sp. ATCC 53533 TaxID=1288362 RepID=UPI000F772F5C|nr:lytic polysaccharide monooxygenase [Actinoplanes sp. ATCC 53533]RSM58122.1 cellulose-binding protein [Actinoplanes sp. ATCC 53533]
MSSSLRIRILISGLAGIVVAALAAVVLPAGPAAAHGNVTGPASRNYGCYERWGSKFQDPTMATLDPMCWQAWQADPNAMWNWNGLFREGVAGNHQAAIPDGQLCSAGRTQSGRYNAMDTVGDWTPTSVGNSFNVRLFDGALHGADYIRVYVTKPGFNPVTTALKWSDLDLVSQIGNTPAAQWTSVSGGVQIDLPVALSGRTGRAMVYTIWQASHLDQSYYFCSDVAFGGTTPPTTPPPSTPPPTTPPTTPPTSTPPATGACTATYAVTSSWQGGFQGEVKVTAGPAAIKGWTVSLAYPAGQTIQQGWNATVSASGSTVTAVNASYNGALAAGASTTFGFIGSGASTVPAASCRATV